MPSRARTAPPMPINARRGIYPSLNTAVNAIDSPPIIQSTAIITAMKAPMRAGSVTATIPIRNAAIARTRGRIKNMPPALEKFHAKIKRMIAARKAKKPNKNNMRRSENAGKKNSMLPRRIDNIPTPMGSFHEPVVHSMQ